MKIQTIACLAAILGVMGFTPSQADARIWYSGQNSTGSYEVELIGSGRHLPVYHRGGHAYTEGRIGERYVIRIHNRTWRRVEAVISVDGRDAIDGRSSSLSKRGYIIPAHSHIDVDGFRINMSQVAAFRFTTVPDSYAARKGTPWNVGIIGVAMFPERVRRPRPPPRWPPYVMSKRGSRPDDWDAAGGSAAESAAQGMYRHKNLGTQFGERRLSPVSETSFVRQNWSGPAARLSLRYDDRQGLCAIGVGAFCYPSYPTYPPYYPPTRQEQFSEPPPGWDHFSPWY